MESQPQNPEFTQLALSMSLFRLYPGSGVVLDCIDS